MRAAAQRGGIAARKPARLTREKAIELVRTSKAEIRALGVVRLALFGSVVRGEARADSDVDVLVRFSPGAKLRPLTVFRGFHLGMDFHGRSLDNENRSVDDVTKDAAGPASAIAPSETGAARAL